MDISPKLSIKEEIEKVEALNESMGEEKEKKKALLLFFNNSGEKITVSGHNTYGSYWIDFAGMENVANKIEGQKRSEYGTDLSMATRCYISIYGT